MKKTIIFGLIFVIGIVIGFSISSSSSVEVLNDGDLFPTLLKEINSADESVHLIVFEIDNDDDPTKELIDALVRAKEKGVDVKIVTDGALFNHKENYDYLVNLGLDVKSDTNELVTHNKLVIIDSEKVIVGSSNWSYHSLVKNHESNVLITNSSIANEFEDYFQEVWDDY
jgi:phosphatidylserine/phosphatidylglycerophosphate/cardiolipin synthase-like enzyme